jgi:hypothetical protein
MKEYTKIVGAKVDEKPSTKVNPQTTQLRM